MCGHRRAIQQQNIYYTKYCCSLLTYSSFSVYFHLNLYFFLYLLIELASENLVAQIDFPFSIFDFSFWFWFAFDSLFVYLSQQFPTEATEESIEWKKLCAILHKIPKKNVICWQQCTNPIYKLWNYDKYRVRCDIYHSSKMCPKPALMLVLSKYSPSRNAKFNWKKWCQNNQNYKNYTERNECLVTHSSTRSAKREERQRHDLRSMQPDKLNWRS